MTRRWVLGVIVLACLLGFDGPTAMGAAATPTCHARNVTQETTGHGLRSMVRAAHAGDRLRVRGTCLGGVVIGKDLTITGTGEHAVVTGLDRYRVFRVRRGATVTLRHLDITRGDGGYDGIRGGGGGVYNEGTVTLVDSLVRRATAGEDPGGAITNIGTMTIKDSVIRRSRADWGGGIGNRGSLTLIGARVVANMPEGIWSQGAMTIIDSIVRDNEWGGVFAGGKDDVSIIDSRVAGNQRGGGITKSGGGTLTLEGSVVAGNSALQDGGGIDTRWGQLVLIATTVTRNTAARYGGGIFVRDGTTTVTLDAASSVTGNVPDDCYGTSAC